MTFSGWYPGSYIRMPFSGIANNFVIWPWHVGDLYYEVSGIEQTLGLNPLGGFATVSARIGNLETWPLGPTKTTTDNALVVWSGIVGAGQKNTSLLVNGQSITSLDSSKTVSIQDGAQDIIFINSQQGFQIFPASNSGIELLTVGGNEFIAPLTDMTGNLGKITKRWKNLYSVYTASTSGSFTYINTDSGVLPTSSGNTFVGSSAKTFKTGYFDGIMLNGITLAAGGTTFTGGAVTSSITPTNSGTLSIGNPALPFGTGYFNQYATSLVSGAGGTKTIDWNLGTAQHLNFNGIASGTYSINLTNGLPGSAYILTTQQNASGTINLAWGPNRIFWQGGTSGIITAASGRIDMFSFYYNGANYLGSFSNNYL